MHPFLSGLSSALPRAGFWDSPAVVAVSGGADSVALLLGLARLAPSGARLVIAHARHDLRPEAEGDELFVASLAGRLGLPCETRSLAVCDDVEGRGEGLEARARRLRYDFLIAAAHACGARHVVVGHTAEDQAETILHRILRGTGLPGLAGMRGGRSLDEGLALLRPMLRLPRALGRGFLADEGEAWREDATNGDLRRARNFLRHEILGSVERGPYPAAVEAIVRLGEHARRSAAALSSATEFLLDRHARRHGDGRVILDAAPLAALDPHLVAALVGALWKREDWPLRDMTARHYSEIASLIAAVGRGDAPSSPRIELPAGLRALGMAGRQIEFRRRPLPASVQ